MKDGQLSIREKEQIKKKELIKEIKQSEIYKSVLKKFPDANLKDIILETKKKV